MTKSLAVLFIALACAPSFALAQGRGNGRGNGREDRTSQGIPPGHLPPPGECRVWIDGRPPGQQPAPTDCRSAERAASRTRDARVIYGDSPYRTEGALDGSRRNDDRRADRRSDDRDTIGDDDRRREQREQGRAIPRGSQYPTYPNDFPQARVPGDRYPETRSQNHPGWTTGYRDGLVKGREDAGKNRSYDPKRHQWYRSASRGYESRYGLRGAYANIYRDGFEAGYDEEFRRTR